MWSNVSPNTKTMHVCVCVCACNEKLVIKQQRWIFHQITELIATGFLAQISQEGKASKTLSGLDSHEKDDSALKTMHAKRPVCTSA